MKIVSRFALAAALTGSLACVQATAQTPAPSDAAKPAEAKPAESAKPAETAKPAEAAAKKPTKAELGEMLKKCSQEADAKGLTIQKGKGEARKAYRRSCMLKNGVAPKKK